MLRSSRFRQGVAPRLFPFAEYPKHVVDVRGELRVAYSRQDELRLQTALDGVAEPESWELLLAEQGRQIEALRSQLAVALGRVNGLEAELSALRVEAAKTPTTAKPVSRVASLQPNRFATRRKAKAK